jgi:tetratricopeptide (TPR) repeat protein
MTKKASASDRRSEKALELFEKAMKAMGKKDFERAQEAFDALIAEHPGERDVVERARAFRRVCERATERKPAFKPKGFDELLHYGVFLHNRGEFDEALRFLREAAELHPKNEHAQYCVAATAARAGETEAALKALRSAIGANSQNRAQARVDSDFDPIREDEEFQTLVYAPLS